ncbi:MAG: hypothetical protein NC203_09725 [Firmicutes bacterium]|nr:hypothetical protein [[Eubacterium] siraeum]MCM1488634.1 hypothetical protein [Bacillota bacterium]
MIKTGEELASKAIEVAEKYKTLYVMCCFGAPMNNTNKERYINEDRYNTQTERAKLINAASSDTFGFDCVNLIKGLLWGWNGDKSKKYGGAVYQSNGVPDIDANVMMNRCKSISDDFSKIEVGEAVGMTGHIGIYVGNGLVVESTPAWKNCVQLTAVGNIGAKAGYPTRTWVRHGKLPYISYAGNSGGTTTSTAEYSTVNSIYRSLGVAAIRNKPTLAGTTVSKRCVRGDYYIADRLYLPDEKGQKWFRHTGQEKYSALTDTDGAALFEFCGTYTVKKSNAVVNIRKAPSLNGDKAARLTAGVTVYATGKTAVADGIKWVQVVYEGQICWCDEKWIL